MRGYNNYDKQPKIKVDGKVISGYEAIAKKLNLAGCVEKTVVMDCYVMADKDEIIENLGQFFDNVFISDYCAYEGDELTEKMQRWLTDDRIFGVLTTDFLDDFFIKEKVEEMRKKINLSKGKTLVIGVGAMLIAQGDVNVHCSIARWETQLRFRKGLPNWNCDNFDMDPLTKFKRGYFVEWRLADKHKQKYFDKFDYFMDTNKKGSPNMICADDYKNALTAAVNTPFRVVPYFDPGVWGGQWMKDVCGLDKDKKNFAWCFDCVPEENSVLYAFENGTAEMPSIDIVFFRGRELLGDRVQARFGNEFPIRFDFLDTIEGGNLSLQVHPTTEYISEHFNMRYTQDESYYILDTENSDAGVYLGVKKDIVPEEFIDALNNAQETGEMDVEKFVNRFPAKKHDHFLIPGGTIHCSGKNTMVLEISSTPYIFTFKLWDWGRVGLDGKPRPINIGHGKNVIDYKRDTQWTKENLINRFETVASGDGWVEEKTGLHEREFIETRRHWFEKEVFHNTKGSVNVLNLVEGEEAEVVSPTGSFENFTVHYGETFIIPANVGDYIIRPTEKNKGQRLATIKALVR